MATRRQKKQNAEDGPSIPLAPAPRNKAAPTGQKTLYELAAERQAELLASQGQQPSSNDGKLPSKVQYVHMNADGEIVHSPVPGGAPEATSIPAGKEDPESLPPLADTIFLSLSLSCIHFTLSFLAAHQFLQEIEVERIIFETVVVAFPVMTLLIHFVHGHMVTFPKPSFKWLDFRSDKQKRDSKLSQLARKSLILALFPFTAQNVFFLPFSVFLGTKLIAMANEASYYAAMKKTPALGTLWVWAVVEMSAGFSVLGLVVPVVWSVWWKGHTLW
ncbi:uncharacterized protein GIQ15_02766 [Arthroderma uncinatum]|uniref:uncharacterized protein n=1 Tax=Arthroderma uncinatum TaxID=74035 RepID=UPI00144A856D|nr:uncharacterized protein GIQ15_02766 [Arthroderma uncinatum]KAF3483442.1 hypothetical protein GIQ15_02766 [Arthroderma uncinatum]